MPRRVLKRGYSRLFDLALPLRTYAQDPRHLAGGVVMPEPKSGPQDQSLPLARRERRQTPAEPRDELHERAL
jgi:hypothetical protein